MASVGFRSIWAGILLSGAFGVAGGCTSSPRDFGTPVGGSAGTTNGGTGDTGAAPIVGGTEAMPGGAAQAGGAGGAADAGGADDVGGAGGAGGAETQSCTPGETKSCNESADGTAYEATPGDDQMTCRLGERICNDDGTWDVCLGAVGPEAADTCEPGNDANCNGTPNEGCTCTNGQKRPCGSDMGNCKQGEQTCSANAWGECVGEVKAAAKDSCDANDDANCNGTPNDGCGCVNGTQKECGKNVGSCKFGSVTCVNGVFPPDTCVGGVKPALADTCVAGNDANCDGTPNEGCGCTGTGSTACGDDTGACSKGMQTCVNGTLGACTGGVVATTNDTCFAANDANDTNCNGNFGDGCICLGTAAPDPCGDDGCGSRTCDGSTGKWNTCKGNGTTLRCNPNAPDSRQICGTSGAWVANGCPSGSVCRNNGADCKLVDGQICVAGTDCLGGTCTSFYLDNDKDGYRANSTVVKFCGTTKSGYVTVAASKGDDCPGDADAAINPDATELCDGIDNNCDGKVDMAGNPALKLSGTSKSLLVGTTPSIAAAGALYGVAYITDKTDFLTLNQNNTLQLGQTLVDADYSFSTAIAWDGSSFGIFYKDNNTNYLQFRKATTAGAFSPAMRVDVGQPGGGGQGFAARLANNTWFITSWGVYAQANWSYYYTVDDTYTPSAYTDVAAEGRWPNLALSGNNVGLVYHGGDATGAAPQTVELSIRDNTGNTETKHVQLRDTSASARKPAIAPRAGGGFAVMWSESTGVYFQEFSAAGASQCGPTYKAFTDFEPDQMVATKRGYLAVSAYNQVVNAQEVLSGCTYGTSFTSIGTSNTSFRPARIAAGANGFAMVWDDDTNVYARTFGPNLCD
jgi:Putative metal-binding motif